MAKGKKTGGRKAGTRNKLTRTVKEAFEQAFNAMQKQPGVRLGEWGKANPTEFYKLSARLIPTELNAKIASQEDAVQLLARGTGGT